MIEAKHVSKHYGQKNAVRDISFTIEDNTVLGFLGRNGAGKSTTMNMLTGYISVSSGDILMNGVSIHEDPYRFRRNIGYLPEKPPLYMDMTVSEYLRFCCEIKKVRHAKIKSHIDGIIGLTGLESVSGRLIRNLSKGYKQRTGIAQTLIGNPDVIILDEPTVGLDPGQILEVRNLIRGLGKQHTVILSSHILSEIEEVCDQVIIIDEGRIVCQDTMDNLTGRNAGKHIVLRVAGGCDVAAYLDALEEVVSCRLVENSSEGPVSDWQISVSDGDVDSVSLKINQTLQNKGIPVARLYPATNSLEEVFLRLTKREV